MEELHLPDISKWPKLLELYQQGNFEKLFEIYDIIEENDLFLCGYHPSDCVCDNNYEKFSIRLNSFWYDDSKDKFYQPIHYAAAHGDLAATRKLIEKYNCSPNDCAKDGRKNSPLMFACSNGHYDIVQYLIEVLKCGQNQGKDLLDIITSPVQAGGRTVTGGRRKYSYHYIIFDEKGKNYLKIARLILEYLQSNFKTELFNIAMQHGNFEDLIYFDNLSNNMFKELFLAKEEKSHHNSLIVTALCLSKCEMIEQIMSHYCLSVNADLLISALDLKASVTVFSILFVFCSDSSVMFNREYYNHATDIDDQKCLFLILVEYFLDHNNMINSSVILQRLIEKFGDTVDSNGQNLLHYACRHQDIFAIELLIKYQPQLQTMKDSNFQLPLHVACTNRLHSYGGVELVCECDIDASDKDGNTPLLIACINQQSTVAEFLIHWKKPSLTVKNKDNLSPLDFIMKWNYVLNRLNLNEISFGDIDMKYEGENTPLHYACQHFNIHLLRHLTKLRASIDKVNDEGDLPVHLYLRNLQNSELQRSMRMEDILLLCNCRIVNIPDKNGDSPLHLLLKSVWTDVFEIQCTVLEYLVNEMNASIELPNSNGDLLIHHIVASKQWNCRMEMKWLIDLFSNHNVINAQDSCGNTALHIACKLCPVSLICFLVEEKEASVTIYNKEGNLAVHCYLSQRHNDVAILEMLLKDNVDIPNSDGNTPLHLACRYFSKEFIYYLVRSKGALIKTLNKNNQSPLHLVLRHPCQNPNTINLLITEEVLFIRDTDGNTPLHIACLNTFCYSIDLALPLHIITIPKFNIQSNKHNYSLLTMREISFDLMNINNHRNQTPMQILLNRYGFPLLKLIRALYSLDNSVYTKVLCRNLSFDFIPYCDYEYDMVYELGNLIDFKFKDESGKTYLHRVCQNQLSATLSFVSFIPCKNETINMKDCDGKTPLHIACENCNNDVVQYLVQLESCIHNIKDNYGNIPLHYRVRKYCLNVLPISCEDIHTFNKDNLSPLCLAIKARNMNFTELLLNRHQKLCDKELKHCEVGQGLFHKLLEAMQELISSKLKCEYDWEADWLDEMITVGLRLLKRLIEENLPLENSRSLAFLMYLASELKFLETERYFLDRTIKYPYPVFSLRKAPFTKMNIVKLINLSACMSRTDLLQYLIEDENNDPLAVNEDGHNALSYACKINAIENEVPSRASIKFLIESGCSAFSAINRWKCSLLKHICSKQDLETFKVITSSCDVINSQNEKGSTPLMFVIERLPSRGQEEEKKYDNLSFVVDAVTYLILDRGCDQTITNKNNETAIHLACRNNIPLEVIKLMNHSAAVLMDNAKSPYKDTPLELAMKYCDFDTFEHLVIRLSLNDNQWVKLLKKALKDEAFNMRMQYTKSQLKVHQVIMFLLKFVSIESILSIVSSDMELPHDLIKYCIEHASVSKPAGSVSTALLYKSCQYNCYESVKRILNRNNTSQLVSCTDVGDTALHVACNFKLYQCSKLKSSPKSHVQHACCQSTTLEYLLQNEHFRSDALSTKNHNGDYPLTVAMKTYNDRWPSSVKVLSIFFWLVRLTAERFTLCGDRDVGKLLHLVCYYSNCHSPRIVKYLINVGAEVKTVDEDGRLPVHYASCVSLDLVKLCIPSMENKTSFVNHQDRDGNTPLHMACFHGNLEVIRYLVTEAQCDVEIKNSKEQTPLHKACCSENVNSEIMKLLLQKTSKFSSDADSNHALHLLCKHFKDEKVECIRQFVEALASKNQAHIILHANEFGLLPLHFLCKSKSKLAYKAAKILLPYINNINAVSAAGDSCLHLACQAEQHSIIHLLAEQNNQCDIALLNWRGETPLHCACRMRLAPRSDDNDEPCYDEQSWKNLFSEITSDFLRSLEYLTSEHALNIKNCDGDTPLHILLRKEYFYERAFPFIELDDVVDAYNDLLECLLDHGASVETTTINGEYPFHLACQYQYFSSIELIEEVGLCTSIFSAKTKNGDNILHCASKFEYRTLEDMKTLFQIMAEDKKKFGEKNEDGNLPMHLVCKAVSSYSYSFDPTILTYMVEMGSSINSQNNDGDTPLHLLPQPHESTVLSICKTIVEWNFNVFLSNKSGKTFLDISMGYNFIEKLVAAYPSNSPTVKKILSQLNDEALLNLLLSPNMDIIKLLNEHGIDPSILYKAHKDFFKDQVETSQIPVPMLFIGNPMTGKTTLINSLKRRAGFEVSELEPERTAGVISSNFKSSDYGQVTVYDFAGQREYYASHEAVMNSIINRSPPIVLLNVKLTRETELTRDKKEIERELVYWINFIANRLAKLSGNKAHLIVIFSHADRTTELVDLSEIPEKYLNLKLSKSNVTLIDKITMDCRESNSNAMECLVSNLANSSTSLRHKGVVSFNAHCLYVFLTRHLNNKAAVRIEELLELGKKNYRYSTLLPKNEECLMELCQELVSNGQVMLVRNKVLKRSFIILNKDILLKEVTGKMFAPSNFPVHEKVFLSETGVVRFSQIKSVFTSLDPNMIVSFLQEIEYCYEIYDQYIMQKLFQLTTPQNNDKYYFFPGLVKTNRPEIDWNDKAKPIQFGWVLKCDDHHQFFTSNFIHVLILRLVFGKTRITVNKEKNEPCKVIESMSKIWKAGLHWYDDNDIDTLVDVVDTASKVVVFMRCCEENKLQLIKHRASVIKLLRDVSKEVCPTVSTEEFFVPSKHIKKCLMTVEISNHYLIPARNVADAINKRKQSIVTCHDSCKVTDITLLVPTDSNKIIIEHLLNENQGIPDTYWPVCFTTSEPDFQSFVNFLTLSSHHHYLKMQLDWDQDGVETDLSAIAYYMIEWEKLAPLLRLTHVDTHDIKEIYSGKPELQRREALRRWKNKLNIRANYENLLKLFVEARRFECAEAVCTVLKKRNPPPDA